MDSEVREFSGGSDKLADAKLDQRMFGIPVFMTPAMVMCSFIPGAAPYLTYFRDVIAKTDINSNPDAVTMVLVFLSVLVSAVLVSLVGYETGLVLGVMSGYVCGSALIANHSWELRVMVLGIWIFFFLGFIVTTQYIRRVHLLQLGTG
jgi:hypothetical protein